MQAAIIDIETAYIKFINKGSNLYFSGAKRKYKQKRNASIVI